MFGLLYGKSVDVNSKITEIWHKNDWKSLKQTYDLKNIFNGDETKLFVKLYRNSCIFKRLNA